MSIHALAPEVRVAPATTTHRAAVAAAGTARAAVSDRESIADLLVLYGEEIADAARRFTRTAADAEDLAQDVRLRALDFAGRFARGTNFLAWIRTMTRNLAINRTRSAARRPMTEAALGEEFRIEAAPERPAAPGTAGRAFADVRDEVSDPIVHAIEDLPEPFRQVLLLWALGEYEYKEIAEIVGCPVGTVMSRLHRARRMLRESL